MDEVGAMAEPEAAMDDVGAMPEPVDEVPESASDVRAPGAESVEDRPSAV
jgi:hypothetical protein